MAVGGNYVLTLAADGGICGWTMMSPSPLDAILRSALIQKEPSYTKQQHLKILAGTWNVSQERALCDSLISWLASPASEACIVVIGLQEMEMGAGFLAMAAAKETVGIEGSANGQWWLDTIGKILDEGMTFERAGSRQLAGLLVAVWVRKDLCPYIGEVDVGAVACGLGRTIGNKGAVALKMRVFRRILCVINCHFAAHADAVARRNADFEYVYRNLTFIPMTAGVNTVAAGVSSAVQRFKNLNVRRGADLEAEKDIPVAGVASEVLPELAEADMLIWFGDFNYRLDDISYDEARNYIACKHFDTILRKDQLRGEMKAGHVFQGMREANIKFPPTYKFDRGQVGLQGYDSSEKKRVPAWCDRVIFRDSRNGRSTQCKLTCPVVASVIRYDACMDVKDSDHKPVRCMFSVDIACVDERIRRREFGGLLCFNKEIKTLLEEYNRIPDTIVSTNNIVLQDYVNLDS
uniref:Inositol polyphosphate-related phosphatase domain-containing protein n=1 Tax=Picea sitchensis TaxID=3332 RepID=D5ADM7_PICSI|nr:unknown [Picea sitchensis]